MSALADRLTRTPPQAIDMHGFSWGNWRVVAKGEPMWNKKHSRASWLCRCECGVEMTVSGTALRSERQRENIRCWRCDP
jgi:hypothetical protein